MQRAMASGGESKVVAVGPSLLGVVPPRSVASTVAVATMVLVAILVVTAEAASEVSLAAPPPPATAKEERETGLPTSPGGGRMAHPPGQSWMCRGETWLG